MTFANTVMFLQAGQAMKLSSWRGYAVKTVDPSDTDGSFTLTFKDRGSGVFAYEYDGTDKTWDVATGGTALTFDGAIMAAMASDDWITGTAEAFEAARTGDTTGW